MAKNWFACVLYLNLMHCPKIVYTVNYNGLRRNNSIIQKATLLKETAWNKYLYRHEIQCLKPIAVIADDATMFHILNRDIEEMLSSMLNNKAYIWVPLYNECILVAIKERDLAVYYN